MISYNDLKYFIELAQTLNFSRASERIGISQPSLSTAIKRLEHFIGAELFIRSKHKVVITPAGKKLLTHTKQLLHLWDTTKSSCLLSQNEVQGTVTIGCHPSVSMYFLPKFLPNLLKQHPKLEVNLKHDLSRKLTEEIINYTVDIGVIVNPIKHPDLIIRKLFDDEVTCWRAKKLSYNNDVVICDPELQQTQVILKKIHTAGIKYKRIIPSSNLEVIANLTAAGAGIGILPARVIHALHPNSMQRVALAPMFHDEVCLAFRHENRTIKSIQAIISAIKDVKS